MGKNKLQAELGVSKEKADSLFKKYHGKVPFVKQLMDSTMNRAQKLKGIRSMKCPTGSLQKISCKKKQFRVHTTEIVFFSFFT